MKAAVVLTVVLTASVASAQPPATGSGDQLADQMGSRYRIAVMERVLEQAVQHGASMLGRQLQAVAPNLVFFTGPARARGFRLEGYGYFFAVDVPALRQSVSWSFRMLNQPDPMIAGALRSLKQHVQSIQDASARASLEAALRRLEGQVGPIVPAAAQPVGGAADAGMRAPAAVPGDAAPSPLDGMTLADVELLDDPAARYTSEVRRALIDAMLDHGNPLPIGPDEWLTVAARDNDGRLTPSEVYEASTLILRIRGSELAAFRGNHITREEARKRVEARDF